MTSKDGHPTITTFTGKEFDYVDPRPEMICIEDIAHALSLICRFGGQTKVFYSVAQHSVLVSQHVQVVPPWPRPARELRQVALLHDAAEAYVGDMCRPLKRLLPEYQAIEQRVHVAIALRFRLVVHDMPQRVRDADNQILANEGISFIGPNWRDACAEPLAALGVFTALDPAAAERAFLARYEELFMK